jgi:hypothetical protein
MKSLYLSDRRDFRLVIADPNNPGKAIVNPVIWLKGDVVIEVKYIHLISVV